MWFCTVCSCFNVLKFHVQSSIELLYAINHFSFFITVVEQNSATCTGSDFEATSPSWRADIMACRTCRLKRTKASNCRSATMTVSSHDPAMVPLSTDAFDEHVGDTPRLDWVEARCWSSIACWRTLSSRGSISTALMFSEDNSPTLIDLPSDDLTAPSVINRLVLMWHNRHNPRLSAWLHILSNNTNDTR